MGWEKILDSYGLRFGCGRGKEGKRRPGALAKNGGRKGERMCGWAPARFSLASTLALSLSRAIYQRGKTSPKHSNEPTNEHVEPPLSLVAVSQNGEGRFYSLEDLSRMTDDGELPAWLKRKKLLQDYGI